MLLKELWKIQDKYKYISEENMKELSIKTGIPIVKIYAAATFYHKFHTVPQGKKIIEICNSPSCFLNDSIDIIKYIEKKLKIKSGETTKDKSFSLHICSCIGCCSKAPAMLVNGRFYGNLSKEKIDRILKCKS